MKIEYKRHYKGNRTDNLRICAIISRETDDLNLINMAFGANGSKKDNMGILLRNIRASLESAKRTNSAHLHYFLDIETDNEMYAKFWKVGVNGERKGLLCEIIINDEL